MKCHPGAAVAAPSRGRRDQRPTFRYPATPNQPRIASPSITSGSPRAFRCCGELLKPSPGRSTSHRSAGGGNKERAPSGALSLAYRSIRHCEDRLAARVLDFIRPGLLNILDDIGRHWNVVEILRRLAAVLVRPGKELESLTGGGNITRLLVDEDPGRRRHWPRAVAGLIGEDHAIAGLRLPIGIGRRRLESFRCWRNRLAGLVDHLGEGQLVLLGVSVLDIADRALGVADIVGNTFVPFG